MESSKVEYNLVIFAMGNFCKDENVVNHPLLACELQASTRA